MPLYHIHRLKESMHQQFRWAPHTSGVTSVRPKDYQEGDSIEARTPYAAWFELRQLGHPLQIGDLLEELDGQLRIYKYVGFEEARWVLPEIKTGLEAAPTATGPKSVGWLR